MKYLCFHDHYGQPKYMAITAKEANEYRTMIGIVLYDKIVNKELKAKRWVKETYKGRHPLAAESPLEYV